MPHTIFFEFGYHFKKPEPLEILQLFDHVFLYFLQLFDHVFLYFYGLIHGVIKVY